MELDNPIIVTIHFRRKEGNEISLDVHLLDDPKALAEQFVQDNSLPELIIPRLIEQIVTQRDDAINQDGIAASSISSETEEKSIQPDKLHDTIQSFDDIQKDYDRKTQQFILNQKDYDKESLISRNQNDYNGISVHIIPSIQDSTDFGNTENEDVDSSPTEEYYEKIRQLWIDQSNTPYSNSRHQITESSPNQRIQLLSTEKLVKVRSTSAPPSASHFSRNYNIRTPTPSKGQQQTQQPLGNQEMFNRLHNHANYSKNRLEILRKRLEQERADIIQSTSFKHNLSQNKRSMESSNRSRSPSVTRSVYSRTPSSIPLPNQEIFDRLHNVANTSKARLERLKKRIENEKDSEVESKMFKYTVSSSTLREREAQKEKSRSLSRGSNFHERLYNHDMQWMKNKERSLSQMRDKINREKELEIEKELTLQPKLISSADSRVRSRSVGEVCESLYKFDNIYKNRRRRLEIKTEVETTKENTFIPKITNNSRRLLAHKRNQLSMSTITMSEFGDDLSFFEEKQQHKHFDPKKDIMSPISSSGYTLQDEDEMLQSLLKDTNNRNNNTKSYNNNSIIFTAKSPLHRSNLSCDREIPDDISHYGYDDDIDLLKLNIQSTHTSPLGRPMRSFQNIDRSQPTPIDLLSKLSIYDNNSNNNSSKITTGVFSPGSESYGKVSASNGSTNKNIIPRPIVQNKVIEVKNKQQQQQQRSVSVGSVRSNNYNNRSRSKSPLSVSSQLRLPTRSKSPNPSRLTRSSSPSVVAARSVSTKGGQNKTLFDKLYEAHWEIEKGKELLKEKYNPSNHSFIPNINKSVDSNKENKGSSSPNNNYKNNNNNDNNKDQFFKRLHDYHNKISEKRELARKNSDQEMKNKIFHNKVLTADEKNDMANRLIHSKLVTDAHIEKLKYKESANTREQQQQKFTTKKSDEMVSNIYRHSLSEIFDALLISVQLSIEKVTPRSSDLGTIIDNDLRLVNDILKVDNNNDNALKSPQRIIPNSTTTPTTVSNKQNLLNELNYPVSVTNSRNNSVDNDKDILNTVLAQPQLLKPKLLADTIGIIIKERAPVPFTREKFITTVQKLMKVGSIPVIGYILNQPIEVCNSVYAHKKSILQTSEEQELKKCTGTPELAARKTTEQLVKDRYKLRHEGRQSIGDSMFSYEEVRQANLEDLKKRHEEEQNKLCPFTPNLISPSGNQFKRKDSNNSMRSSNTSLSSSSFRINKSIEQSLDVLNNNGKYKVNNYVKNHFNELSNNSTSEFIEEEITFDM